MQVCPIYIEAGISGFESPAAEYRELGLSLDDLLVKHPSATFIGRASGHSMQDVGIFEGDLLIVDRSVEPKHGDVIVANYNGGFVCKLLDVKQRRLVSASASYPPVSISQADEFQIEGVVGYSVRVHGCSERLL